MAVGIEAAAVETGRTGHDPPATGEAGPDRPNPGRELFDDDRAGRIYRTAARMIYEKGFEATSMNAIAEAVKLTKPGLYYYVGRKKELLFSIMTFAMDLLDREVVEPTASVPDPVRRLRAIVVRHARLLTHDIAALAVLIDEVDSLSAEQREKIVDRKRRYLDYLRRTLDEIRALGRLRPVDTTVAAFSLLGMVMWISRWYDARGPLSGREVAEELAEIALGGVLRDPSSGEETGDKIPDETTSRDRPAHDRPAIVRGKETS